MEKSGVDFKEIKETSWGDEREDWTDIERIKCYSSVEVVRFFADFLRFLIRMDPDTQRVVIYWIWGRPLRMAAAELGITEQAVHRRLKKAHSDFPNLEIVKSVSRSV